MNPIEAWFRARGWKSFPFQRQAWQAYLNGESGLIHAPTGVGKTLAAWLGPVAEALAETKRNTQPSPKPRSSKRPAAAAESSTRKTARNATPPLRVLWITPLKALANDTLQSIREPAQDLNLNWSIELRTGDAAASIKAKQRDRLPSALVITPESLALLLSYPDAREKFATLRCVVVDEWHELIGAKRGVQTELCLARLRRWNPALRVWGISATLGNLDQAAEVLHGAPAPDGELPAWRLVQSDQTKSITVSSLLPEDVRRYPWAGHIGTHLADKVCAAIDAANTSLLFTNTRAQAEIWFQALMRARPDWIGAIALHHGSLEKRIRTQVEKLLAAGRLKCVVCTSSLDLGIDFSPVDRVFQVGSPKGIARLLQRAGRSGHQPGAKSSIVCVPSHSFELIEFAAARRAIEARNVEARTPLEKPLDLLVQHLVTIACGGGFDSAALFSEVRSTHAYRNLTPDEWGWCLDFCLRGGPTLTAYPQFARLRRDDDGLYQPADPRVARMHRMNIGTITAQTSLTVKKLNGSSLGTIEEDFISRLTPGDFFVFSGKTLEFVRVQGMSAYVKVRRGAPSGIVPRWNGARFPLSTQLGAAVRHAMATALDREPDCPEIAAALPLLHLQAQQSRVPGPDEVLLETTRSRDGHHWFAFLFEGRLVHEGLAALCAYRLSQRSPRTIHITCNDYGFELLTDTPLDLDENDWLRLLATDDLLPHLLACLNATQMARRQFRDIARIAGLISPGFPGAEKATRHLQASSDLFFDVFRDFDPTNLLLTQAQREVMDQQLELNRLIAALRRTAAQRLMIVRTATLTPLSFPLWAERLRAQSISSESWTDRVKKAAEKLEAGEPPRGRARPPTQRGRR